MTDAAARCPFCGREQRLISRYCPNCGRDRWSAPEFSRQFRSASTRAQLTIGLLGVCALLSAIEAVLVSVRYRWTASTGEMSVTGFESVSSSVALAYVVAFLATAIVFLAWQSRSVDNVPHLTGSYPAVTPGWSVGWWFVPIANLVKPYQIIKELNDRLATEKRNGGNGLVLGWWLIFLADRLAFVPFVMTQRGRSAAELQELLPIVSGFNAFGVVAAALGIVVVSRIQARADERAQYLPQAPAITPELPTAEVPMPPCPRCGGARERGQQLCPTCGLDLWAAFDEAARQQGMPSRGRPMSHGARIAIVGIGAHVVLSLLTFANSDMSVDPELVVVAVVAIALLGTFAFGIFRRSRMAYAFGVLLAAGQLFTWAQLAGSDLAVVLVPPLGAGLVLLGLVISWRDAWTTVA